MFFQTEVKSVLFKYDGNLHKSKNTEIQGIKSSRKYFTNIIDRWHCESVFLNRYSPINTIHHRYVSFLFPMRSTRFWKVRINVSIQKPTTLNEFVFDFDVTTNLEHVSICNDHQFQI